METISGYDVAVFGGGFCGLSAAVAIAESGQRVLLVERRCVLGWEATWAFQMELRGGVSRLADELVNAIDERGGHRDGVIDPPITEMVLDQTAAKYNVDVLYYCQPVGLAIEGELVKSVIVAGKSGELAVQAKGYVDATENAFLLRQSGIEFSPPERKESVYAVFLNGVDAAAKLPKEAGDGRSVPHVAIKQSVWEGEVALQFDIGCCDIREARRLIPDVLKVVRGEAENLSEAIATHVASEPFALGCWKPGSAVSVGHPRLRNLFGAGPWVSPATEEDERGLLLARRIEAGEGAGQQIAQLSKDLPHGQGEPMDQLSIASPPVKECEVLVCGGGTAGAIAAIASARQGAGTTLVEPSTCLGGIGTGGAIHAYYHGVSGGIQDEVDERVNEMTPLFAPNGKVRGFHPEVKKVVLQQMAEEAGVEIDFDTTVTDSDTEALPTKLPTRGAERGVQRIKGVSAVSPEGNLAYRAAVVIDSTGDGDVAAMAGAEFTLGRHTDNLPHAFSLVAGRLDAETGLVHLNFDAGYCDPTDVVDLTRARRLSLSHYYRERFTNESRLLYIAPLIGLRNSRQIIGDYQLRLSDQIAGREFPDVIAYAFSHFDNHGFDYENESDEAMLWVWVFGNWRKMIGCEIPYRCLLPRGLEGLIVACRAVSITHDAHNQLRMQRDMQRIGEAAGVAAALAVKESVTPREVDISRLQELLYESGALGPRERKALPAPEKVEYHPSDWQPEQLPAKPVAEWAAELHGEQPQVAACQLVRAGKDGAVFLRAALKSDNPRERLWAAVGLAALRQPEAAPELIDCLSHRRKETPEGRKAVPLWVSSLPLLGMLRCKEAVPAILGVLSDKDADLDTLIAAIRTLGRIGEKSAAEPILKMLQRRDLPTTRIFQVSTRLGVNPVADDARWQLELAAAETLAVLGKPQPQLVERHKNDPRAYVRRYANKVAQVQVPPQE